LTASGTGGSTELLRQYPLSLSSSGRHLGSGTPRDLGN
ncbi:hypothetical protein T01_11296, partial [Trichinella spiralis]